MRPASQKLNSRLPMVEMADAAGSSASAMAVASSISAGPSVGASGIFGSSLVTNVCSMLAQRRAQRLDVAAEQEQRQRGEDAGKDGGDDDRGARPDTTRRCRRRRRG